MMAAALIALLFLATPSGLAAQSAAVSVELNGEARAMFGDADSLASRISYFLSLPAGVDAESRFAISISAGAETVSIDTSLIQPGKAARSLASSIPSFSVGSLIPTLCGDIAYLRRSSLGFPTTDLAQPPPLLDRLSYAALGKLTGWSAADLEPMGIASLERGIVLCFPRKYLSLGSGFAVTQKTISDMIFQAQSDPLLFSGMAADGNGRVVLLSESAGKTVISHSRLGRREVSDAPGVKGPRARIVGGNLASVDGSTLTLYRLEEAGGTPARIQLRMGFVSALAADEEDNLWLFDAEERRIRVCSAGGSEIYSIKPLVSPSAMPLPQSLAVYPDGSFILGGSGQIWKFDNTGNPIWRLTRIPGARQETLPAAFALAVDASDGSFYVLDAPSRRVLRFAGGSGGDAASGPTESGLLARADSTAGEAFDREMIREKALRAGELIESLIGALSYDRANGISAAAAELARQYRATHPADGAASRLHDDLTAKKRSIAEIIAEPEAPSVAIFEPARGPRSYPECTDAIGLTVTVRNTLKETLENLRVSISIPGMADSPEMILFASLLPGEERTLPVSLAPTGRLPGYGVNEEKASVLAVFSRRKEAKTAFRGIAIIGIPSVDLSKASLPDAADLACAARPDDPLLDRFARSAAGIGEDPLEQTISLLDALSRLRRQAAKRVDPIPAAQGIRGTLRGLSGGPEDWAVLMASLASNRGLDSGILTAGDETLALIQTGVPLGTWLPIFEGRRDFFDILSGLARGGMLVIPLAGSVSAEAGPAGGIAGSLLAALEILREKGGRKSSPVWLEKKPAAAPSAAGIPFPIALPAVIRIGRAELEARIADMFRRAGA